MAGPVNNFPEVVAIKRLLTALLFLPLLLLCLFWGGGAGFAILASLFSFLGLHEYYRMSEPQGGYLLPTILGASLPLAVFRWGLDTLPILLAVIFLVTATTILLDLRDIRQSGPRLFLSLSGWIYIPLLLSFLVRLRAMENGQWWILLLLVAVMFSDTAAFYVGTAIGKHKLYPAVSPNKSVEGSLAGIVGSLAGALLLALTLFPEISPLRAAGGGLLAGIAGQIGDLFESMLKRSAGVKDSGTLFPGHGGVLDRLDSILFAAPVIYLYVGLVTGVGA